MTNDYSTTPALIPLLSEAIDDHSKPGVSARVLYAFLELNQAVWARWAKKNIVTNPYAIEHTDWEYLQPDVENPVNASATGRPSQDFVLSIDFAKRLAMMARSAKGEDARKYFLACEKAAQQESHTILPTLHDPKLQAILQLTVRLDDTEYRLQKTEAKAEQALRQQEWISIRQFVYVHGIGTQMPASYQREYATFLTGYCVEKRIPMYRIGTAGEVWKDEKTYHVGAIQDTLWTWLKRRNGQGALVVMSGGREE